MAKSKVTELWLSRDKWVKGETTAYILWRDVPVWNPTYKGWNGSLGVYGLCEFCPYSFHRLCPSLKLNPGECVKVRLTNTTTGISLRKIGKPFKEGGDDANTGD